MKLKKIASLMLAGVMAISMLAGCSNGGNTEKPEEPTTSTTATNYAVEDLTEAIDQSRKDDFTVTASASLQTALDAAAKVPGLPTTDFAKYMTSADSTLKTDLLENVQGSVDNKATVEASTFGVAQYTNKSDYNTKTAVQKLVDAFMANVNIQSNNEKLGNVASASGEFTDKIAGVEGDKYKYEYDYSVEVAVTSVENPVTNVVVYVMAYKVTRTPVKVEA